MAMLVRAMDMVEDMDGIERVEHALYPASLGKLSPYRVPTIAPGKVVLTRDA